MGSANEYEQHYEIGREHKGLSLFDFLDAVVGPVDRKRVSSAARDKHLRLNGEPVSPGATLRVGDLVERIFDVTKHCQARVHLVHHAMKVDALLCGDFQCLEEEIHQKCLAAAYATPDIQASNSFVLLLTKTRKQAFGSLIDRHQLLRDVLEQRHHFFLRGIAHVALAFQTVFPSLSNTQNYPL